MEYDSFVRTAGQVIDVAGVLVIVTGAAAATAELLHGLVRHRPVPDPYRRFRQRLGRAILLGLEFLVAGDIIRTVAISPTFRSAGVLALIVAVRTFLSFSLEVELEGRWPWQQPRTGGQAARPEPEAG